MDQRKISVLDIGVVRNRDTNEYAAAIRSPTGKTTHGPWRETEAEAETEANELADLLTSALREAGNLVAAVPTPTTVN